MPPLTRWQIKSAFLYLPATMTLGAVFEMAGWLAYLSPQFFHLIMVGWVTQLIRLLKKEVALVRISRETIFAPKQSALGPCFISLFRFCPAAISTPSLHNSFLSIMR